MRQFFSINITQRQAALVLLSVQCLAILFIFLDQVVTPTRQIFPTLITGLAALVYGGLLVAYWRGWEYARHTVVVILTLLIGFTLPEPFISRYMPFILILHPVLALVLTGPLWVIGSAATTWFILLARADWQGVYANPETIGLYATGISCLVLSQWVAETAQRALEARRQEAEQQAQALSQRNQAIHFQARLLEAVEQAVIATDLEGKIIYWNRFAKTLYGWPAEEVLGRNVVQVLVAETDVGEAAVRIARLRAGKSLSGESVLRHRDGSRLTVLATASPIYDGEGKLIGLIGVSSDITERKQAEAALQASQERYLRTLDNMLEGCQIISFDWRYLYVNDVVAQHGRQTKAALLGHTMLEVYPGIENTELFAALRRCMDERLPRHMENEFVYADGSKEWFELSIEPAPEGLFVLSVDVTQRKRAEDEIRRLNADLEQRVHDRTAQLEAANRELESFSYSVSHDLRAPLRAMDGFSRILLEDYAPQLPAEAQHYLDLVRHNAQQMSDLVEALLALSRLGRQALKLQPVALDQLVRDAWEELRAEQNGRRVEFTLGDLPSVQADPALLKQVLLNLLTNALKFTRQREVTTIQVGSRIEGGKQVYFVKDNGVGFDMRYASKLFGVFQRLHRAEEYEGTGVGLATVQRIIHRHRGRVWAEGEIGQGATFYFTLEGEPSSDS